MITFIFMNISEFQCIASDVRVGKTVRKIRELGEKEREREREKTKDQDSPDERC